jgi:hypothetical protein
MVLSSRSVPNRWHGPLRHRLSKQAWAAVFGPLSGERVMLRSSFARALALAEALDWAETTRGFGLAVFLNRYFERYENGFEIEYLEGLRQRMKYEKRGLFQGLLELIHEFGEFFVTDFKIRRRGRTMDLAFQRLTCPRGLSDCQKR